MNYCIFFYEPYDEMANINKQLEEEIQIYLSNIENSFYYAKFFKRYYLSENGSFYNKSILNRRTARL